MITQDTLVQHLRRRALGAWSVVERAQDLASAAEQPARRRRDHRTRLTLIVHHDVPRGRGSARLDLAPGAGSPADLVDQAIALALTTVGPAWTSTPPAAPARVDLVDPDLLERELGAVAQGTLTRLRRPAGVTVTAAATVLRETVTVVADSGFHARWLATALHARATLAAGDHLLTLSRRARRAADLDLDPALASAAADLALLATAGPPVPGPCALWLGPDALVPDLGSDLGSDLGRLDDDHDLGDDHPLLDGDGRPLGPGPGGGDDSGLGERPALGGLPGHGLWTVFAQEADAATLRQGLTRYRLHAPITPGAPQLPEPLTITSDGALDFAPLSAPVTDDAVAIRRFPLIERGVATGLGLSRREAALRATDPNGGVRNLVVAPGTWSPSPSPTARTIEVRRLHALTIDPSTGDATLDIALGLDHRPGRPSPTPFTGGTVRLDLVAALARARRASQLLRRAAYHGPAAVLIDDAELIA